MFVNPTAGDTRIVRLPRPTKINQRVLGSAVVGLLAANAFAAAVIAGDVGAGPVGAAAAEAASAPTGTPQTVTLVTTADGRRLLVDPSTPEGRKAIADAKRQGATTRDVAIPARTGPGSSSTLPGGLDLGRLLGDLPSGGALEVGQEIVDQLLDPGTVTSVIEGAKTTVSSVVGGAQTTVSSVLGDTQTTVSSVLASTPSTLTSVLGGVQPTVTSVVGGTQSTVTSVLHQVTPTSVTPTSSLLGTVLTTVSTVVQSVTPTTSAPPPTTVPGPLCGLLAHC
jgi:hypothetical protein